MRKVLSILFVLLIGGLAFAQSAQEITNILNTDEVTYGQVCYLSAIHQNLIAESDGYDDAIKVLYENGQLPELVSGHMEVYMQNLAYIYLQMWPDVKGGLFYKLTKGSPRYAFKQLKTDGIIPEDADPNSVVSGRDALNILTACMMTYGGEEECMSMDVE
ncbi:MAG: hypothetical protein J5726_11405 [Treponema sp.]|nr:hypothetical protein [Treponema sp.]